MERTAWTDEGIDDAFTQLRAELREFRADMRAMRAEQAAELRAIRSELFQLRLFMLAGLVTILAAVIALHG
jgi:hypothetical protein